MKTFLDYEGERHELVAMPVGKHAKRKAARRETARDATKSKAIGRAKRSIKNRRHRRMMW